MQAMKSSGKNSYDKVTADEIALALHHYGLSRHFAASGHPSLSSQNNHLARLIIAQNDRASGSELSSNSRQVLSDVVRSEKEGDNGLLPQWQQIHNRNCSVCENPLLLGVNCSSVKGGMRCDVCGSTLVRLGADRSVKRTYRSTRLTGGQQERSLMQIAKEPIHKDAMSKVIPEIASASLESKIKAVEGADTVMTLEQRSAHIKKEKKSQRKWQKDKPVPRKIDWMGESTASEKVDKDAKSPLTPSEPPVKVQGAQKSMSLNKTGLQKLLAIKKAKADSEDRAKEQKGGLQDFLGSLQ